MKIIEASDKRAAAAEILHLLGHDFTGSIQAGIDATQIQMEDDGDRLALVCTHVGLPGVEVVVPW